MAFWQTGLQKRSSQLYSHLSTYNFAIGIQLKMLNNSLLFLSGSLVCQRLRLLYWKIDLFLELTKHFKKNQKTKKCAVIFEIVNAYDTAHMFWKSDAPSLGLFSDIY